MVRLLSHRPRRREQSDALVAEGVRLVEEVWRANWPVRLVLHGRDVSARGAGLLEAMRRQGVEVDEVSQDLMEWISATETPQGILAVVERRSIPIPAKPDFLLILDQVRDPGNLGTLVRTAAAAGVDGLLLPPGSADPFSPKAIRAAMGATFAIPIVETSWAEIRAKSEELQIFLAEAGGVPAWQADLRRPLALIIGGEAEGASLAARETSKSALGIPMHRGIESLNAAAAGAILMFEVCRQRSESPG